MKRIVLVITFIFAVVTFSYAQQIDRSKIEGSGYALQRYSNQMTAGYACELTGMGVFFITTVTRDINNPNIDLKQVKTINTICSLTIITGLVIQVNAQRELRIAGQKLELADSGIGLKYRF